VVEALRMPSRPWLLLFVLAVIPLRGAHGEEPKPPPAPPDAFAQALADMGIGVDDLGYRPKGTWARYPHTATTAHLLPFFPDLLAHPLDTYEFTRTLGNAVEDLLTPEVLTAAPDAKDRRETLFKLGVTLATDRRIGGFRGYSANLDPRPDENEPLLRALLTLLERSGTPLRVPMAFGQPPADPKDDPWAKLREQVAQVPTALHLPLARYVLNLIEAREWIDRGLRRVTLAQREQVFTLLRTLTDDTPDGTRYHPVLDDVAREIDEHSLHYGCLKALQATQDARRELGTVPIPAGRDAWPHFELEVVSGWGDVRIGSNLDGDEHPRDPLLFVHFGQRYVWGPAGATSARRSLSVALLMDYAGTVGDSHSINLRTDAGIADVASGVLGCGIVYSSGTHGGSYRTGRWGLGAGLFGLGALIDEGGNDHYQAASAAQGAAFFGAGLLLDAGGDDEYELHEGDGQGFGGPGGIGILADRSGDDTYTSEPDAAKAGRADYHSDNKVAVSNAQGVGSGRRGDGSDGHAWAGGLGALLDVDGNDTYTAGNFSQGLGYWYGTGLLWDGGGDDAYVSVYFTQGSGAHFAVGALIDESGNDVHRLEPNAGAAFGFGWDVVNAFLLDRGTGNDRYDARIISYGLGQVRSNGFFLDEGGDDTYVLDAGAQGLGDVDSRPEYTVPGRTTTFPFHLGQVGVFLDLGGKDAYHRRAADGTLAVDPDAKDDATWRLLARDPSKTSGPNVTLGRDLPRGRLGFLDAFPARTPPPHPPRLAVEAPLPAGAK
jgi:hypothetical protein